MRNNGKKGLAAGALVLVLALAGCAAGTTTAGSPPPAPTSTSTPTPTPEPVSTAVTQISMDAEGLRLLTDSGVEQGIVKYTDDPAASVALLTETLQSEPVLSAGANRHFAGTMINYRWGGLVLQTEQEPDNPSSHWMGANFIAPVSGSVRLVAPGGLSVGDSTQDSPDPIAIGSYEGSPNGPRRLLGEPVPFTLGDEENVEEYFNYVEAYEDPTGKTLIEFVAPTASYGGPGWEVLTYTGRA